MSLRTFFRKIHDNSPASVKAMIARVYASLPNRLHFGSTYQEAEKLVNSAAHWKPEQIVAFQEEQLSKLLSRANELSYYRDFGKYETIETSPLITKQVLRDFTEKTQPSDIRKYKAEGITTGGSTGEPLKIYLDRNGLAIQKATRSFHAHLSTGLKRPRTLVLRGAVVDTAHIEQQKISMLSIDKMIQFMNAFSISGARIHQYIAAWNQFQPELVFAFPSSLTELCLCVREVNETLTKPKAIITSSETLHEDQKQIIEDTLGITINDFLGMSECECIAFQRTAGADYIVDSHIAAVEIMQDGKRVGPGESGHIVLTHLHNFCQPIIRYRTGDRAIVAEDGLLPNGFVWKIQSVQGRENEVILTKDGTKIGISNFNMHSDYWIGVLQYQIIQEEPGKITVLLKVEQELPNKKRQLIEREVKERMGDGFEVTLQEVRHTFRTPLGKTPLVLQRSAVEDFNFN